MLWYDCRNEPKTVLPACYEPKRWGLPAQAAHGLSARLDQLSQRYHTCFVTKTRDVHEHAETYLRGQLTMDAKRNFANVERRVAGGDGQAIQHFTPHLRWVQVCRSRPGRVRRCSPRSNWTFGIRRNWRTVAG